MFVKMNLACAELKENLRLAVLQEAVLMKNVICSYIHLVPQKVENMVLNLAFTHIPKVKKPM